MTCDAELLAKCFATFRTDISPVSSIAHRSILRELLTYCRRVTSLKIGNTCYRYVERVTHACSLMDNQFFFFSPLWRCGPTRAMASSFFRFLDHTQRRITVGRTPLDEWSARRRDLYLTTHNTHNRKTFMPPVGFEPMISAGERPQTYALDRAATGTGNGELVTEL